MTMPLQPSHPSPSHPSCHTQPAPSQGSRGQLMFNSAVPFSCYHGHHERAITSRRAHHQSMSVPITSPWTRQHSSLTGRSLAAPRRRDRRPERPMPERRPERPMPPDATPPAPARLMTLWLHDSKTGPSCLGRGRRPAVARTQARAQSHSPPASNHNRVQPGPTTSSHSQPRRAGSEATDGSLTHRP